MEQLAEYRFANDHRRQTDDDGAPAHADICKALILCQQRTAESHQTVGDRQPEHQVKIGVKPCARDIWGLEPVARMPQPSSVPKNQYKTPMTAAVASVTTAMGLRSASSLTQRSEISRSYLSTLMDWFALPMIFRFTE